MKKCVKDLIAGAVLALCSIGYYIASHSIQSFGSNKDFISARTIPVAWAVLLLVLSVVLMVRSYAEIRHLKATGEEIFSGRTPKDWLADNYASSRLSDQYVRLSDRSGRAADAAQEDQ